MFTDIVGFTALNQSNETQALVALERHNKLLRPLFPKFNGKEIKTIGDSFLVEFDSALEATLCAIEIQKFLHDYNVSTHEDWKIKLRIGLHLGDIVRKGTDILGDSVNIASRIQPLAEPEGICITQQVFDQIHNKIEYSLEKLEHPELKNVKFQTNVYNVLMPWQKRARPLKVEGPIIEGNRRRIAVLPFTNMSPDPNDEYFSDGMTEELISTISKISGLKVIARTSVMAFKGERKMISDIAKQLQVGTVLEGSVRKSGDRIKVTVQLIDSQTSESLWSETYDRELKDVLTIQMEISKSVSESLRVRLLSQEKGLFDRKQTVNPVVYSLCLKGRFYWNEREKDSVEKAVKYFQRAVKTDPSFAPAYSGLADCYIILGDYGWMSPEKAYPLGMEFSKKALDLDESLAEAHASYALMLVKTWDPITSQKEFKRAIELSPNYAAAHHFYSTLLLYLRKVEEALVEETVALELDPSSPIFSLWLSIYLIYLRKPEEALHRLTQLVQMNPDFSSGHIWKSLAHSILSDYNASISEALKAVELEKNPSTELNLAAMYAAAGKKMEADKILQRMKNEEGRETVPLSLFGWTELLLGRKDEGFASLEKALEARDETLFMMSSDPLFEPFSKDPRWLNIEGKLEEGLRRPLSRIDHGPVI
jgi:adenylate cyclase